MAKQCPGPQLSLVQVGVDASQTDPSCVVRQVASLLYVPYAHACCCLLRCNCLLDVMKVHVFPSRSLQLALCTTIRVCLSLSCYCTRLPACLDALISDCCPLSLPPSLPALCYCCCCCCTEACCRRQRAASAAHTAPLLPAQAPDVAHFILGACDRSTPLARGWATRYTVLGPARSRSPVSVSEQQPRQEPPLGLPGGRLAQHECQRRCSSTDGVPPFGRRERTRSPKRRESFARCVCLTASEPNS